MDTQIITKLQKTFEDHAQHADGVEFWLARDLQILLGYDKWDNFVNVIEKAKIACKNSGHKIEDHFPEVEKSDKHAKRSNKRDYRFYAHKVMLIGTPIESVNMPRFAPFLADWKSALLALYS